MMKTREARALIVEDDRSWQQILTWGRQSGTFSMGCIVRREAALSVPFLAEIDAGEDWEWALSVMASYSFAKLPVAKAESKII